MLNLEVSNISRDKFHFYHPKQCIYMYINRNGTKIPCLSEQTGEMGERSGQCISLAVKAGCFLFRKIIRCFGCFLSSSADLVLQSSGAVIILALHSEEYSADDDPDSQEDPGLWAEEAWGERQHEQQDEEQGKACANAADHHLLFIAFAARCDKSGCRRIEEAEIGANGSHINEPGKHLTPEKWRDHSEDHHEQDAETRHMVFAVELLKPLGSASAMAME